MKPRAIKLTLIIGKFFICALCSFVPFSGAAPFSLTKENKLKELPLIIPFNVQTAGSTAVVDVHVVTQRYYTFALRLMFKENDPKDRERIKKIAGSFGTDTGLSIPIKLTIQELNSPAKKLLIEKEYSEEEMGSFGADSYDKSIDKIELKPGNYRICVKSLKDIEELTNTQVYFGIGYRIK